MPLAEVCRIDPGQDRRRGLETWRSCVQRHFRQGLDVDLAGHDLHVRLETISFAGARLWRLSSCPQVILRTRALQRRDFLPVAVLQMRGTSIVSHSDRTCRLDPGTFAFVDAAKPLLFDHQGEFTQIYLEFPESMFAAAQFENGNAVPIDTSRPADRLFFETVERLWEALPDLHPLRHSSALSAATSLCAITSAFEVPERPARLSVRAVRAMELIERDLGEPDLTATMVAEEQGVSRRHLDELFAPLGFGVSAWIWERRLLRVAETLRTDAPRTDSLLVLALDHGFKSQSHFSRAFAKRFGMSPRAYRARHQLHYGGDR